jgi:hypothetical protein
MAIGRADTARANDANDAPLPGRPPKMQGGRRINLWLDAATIKRAQEIGDGSISEGLRKAVRNYPAPKTP